MRLSENKILYLIPTLVAMCIGVNSHAQDGAYDIFTPISKYLGKGDADSLSAWFDDNLEVSIFSDNYEASRNQALRVFKTFFNNYSPNDFEITHTAGQSNMKYAIGTLKTTGEQFQVTIFVTIKNNSYKIQQLKISRNE